MREAKVNDIEETEELKVEVVKKQPAQAKTDKKESSAGRKKVSESQKKKARQVFYNDISFAEIEECADFLGVEPKTFMQMAINQKVKAVLKDMGEA